MSEEQTIDVGHVVTLRSGGLPMTVSYDGGSCAPGHVRCCWHCFHGLVQVADLPKAALVRVDPEDAEAARAAAHLRHVYGFRGSKAAPSEGGNSLAAIARHLAGTGL